MENRRNKKKEREEGGLAVGALPDYVEPSTRDRVPNKVDSTGKLNVCHGLIDRKNRCVGRQAAEKSLPNCSRFMGYAIVIPCQISPVFTLRISLHMCVLPISTRRSISMYELRARISVTEISYSWCNV